MARVDALSMQRRHRMVDVRQEDALHIPCNGTAVLGRQGRRTHHVIELAGMVVALQHAAGEHQIAGASPPCALGQPLAKIRHRQHGQPVVHRGLGLTTTRTQTCQTSQHGILQYWPGQRAQAQQIAQHPGATIAETVTIDHHQSGHPLIIQRILVAIFGARTDADDDKARQARSLCQQIERRPDVPTHLRQHPVGPACTATVTQPRQVQPQRRHAILRQHPANLHMDAVRPDAVNHPRIHEQHADRCRRPRGLHQRAHQVPFGPQLHQAFPVRIRPARGGMACFRHERPPPTARATDVSGPHPAPAACSAPLPMSSRNPHPRAPA